MSRPRAARSTNGSRCRSNFITHSLLGSTAHRLGEGLCRWLRASGHRGSVEESGYLPIAWYRGSPQRLTAVPSCAATIFQPTTALDTNHRLGVLREAPVPA